MNNLDPYLVAAWLSALAAFIFLSASKTSEELLCSKVLYFIGLVALAAADVAVIIYEFKILEWI